MKKNKFSLNIILQLSISVLILGLFLIPYTSKAVSVPLTYNKYHRFQDIKVQNGEKEIYIYSDIHVSLSKEFNLVSGGRNLNSPATIAKDSTITSNSSKAIGSFNTGGSAWGTPPLDGLKYDTYQKLVWQDAIPVAVSWNIPFGGIVVDETTYTLSSDNPSVISCLGTTCSAVGPGSASITVNWTPKNEYYAVSINRFYIGPAYNGETKYPKAFDGAWVNGETTTNNFYVKPISYTITVPTPPDPPAPAPTPPASPAPAPTPPASPAPAPTPPASPAPEPTPPTPVVEVSNVRAEDITITTATIKWKYTNSLNYPQQSSQVQVATDAGFTKIEINQAQLGTSTYEKSNFSVPISGLTANTKYYIRVRATDEITSLNSQPWVVGTPFTTNSYPDLIIDYNLKSGTQTVGKGSTTPLTVKTRENVNAIWNITDTDGGIVDGLVGTCNIESGGFNAINGTGLPLSSNKSAAAPEAPTDMTYTINLSCAAKPGGIAVNEGIPLKVESYPVLSCNTDNKKSVSSEDSQVKIEARVGNVLGYTWRAGIKEGDDAQVSGGRTNSLNSTDIFNINLNYTGIPFGKYQPWVEVTKNGTDRKTKSVCGTITSFGDNNIKEINP